MVTTRPQRHRDRLQAHYTRSPEIVEYLVSRLLPEDGDTVWEPAGGQGELVDGVLRIAPNADVWVSEIDPLAVAFLQQKYRSLPNVQIDEEDAIGVQFGSLLSRRPPFQKVIANPPFGAWQSYERRAALKRRFPQLYVRDSYGVFLYHCFDQLESGGRLVFIVPDTFLWLHRHEHLRRTLLREGSVEEIALFPSRIFPNVSFGYSGMSVLTVRKVRPPTGFTIQIIDEVSRASMLAEIAHGGGDSTKPRVSHVAQEQVLARSHAELVLPRSESTLTLLDRASQRTLGMVADVRTGFYSGNDRRWVRRAGPGVPRSTAYEDVDRARIMLPPSEDGPPLEGISDSRCFIPLMRGGAAQFRKTTQWYVDWSLEAVREYRRPGKNPARFQNSIYYFREGIGVPMVASGRVTAAMIERRLFDQGVVGVFPRDSELLLFLLGFLNSRVATGLLRAINPTANNSAKYLARLPFVDPTPSQLRNADQLVKNAFAEVGRTGGVSLSTLNALDEFYSAVWLLDECRSGKSSTTANRGRWAG